MDFSIQDVGHRYTIYYEGINDEPEEVTQAKHNHNKEDKYTQYLQQRQKQYERLAIGSLLPENVLNYQNNVNKLQNQIESSKIDTNKSEVVKQLEDSKIDYNPVQRLKKILTDDEIIQKVSGGDTTKGSCSSLGFAYIANKNGLDVLDFRGGASQDFFSTSGNIYKISQLPGIKSLVEENFNDIMGAMNLLKTLEEGKEYYLATGSHAAIVRKVENKYQFLELQSLKENGFKPLTTDVLRNRFHCKQTHSVQGIKLKTKNILMEVDSFKDNSEFEKIMGYINTSANKQIQGVGGSEK